MFRAVENNRYVLQAANTGISAIISPKGTLIQRSDLDTQTSLVSNIALDLPPSFYTLWGDLLVYVSLFLVTLLCISRTILGRHSSLEVRDDS